MPMLFAVWRWSTAVFVLQIIVGILTWYLGGNNTVYLGVAAFAAGFAFLGAMAVDTMDMYDDEDLFHTLGTAAFVAFAVAGIVAAISTVPHSVAAFPADSDIARELCIALILGIASIFVAIFIILSVVGGMIYHDSAKEPMWTLITAFMPMGVGAVMGGAILSYHKCKAIRGRRALL